MRLIALLFFVPVLTFSQLRTITGSVIDEETNEPLIGATVVLEYRRGAGDSLMKQITNTNVDGQFSLSPKWDSPPVEFTLQFSYIGYEALVNRYRGSVPVDTLLLGPIGLGTGCYWDLDMFLVRPVEKQSNFIQYLYREDLLNHPQR